MLVLWGIVWCVAAPLHRGSIHAHELPANLAFRTAPRAASRAAAVPGTGSLRALVIFAKFQGEALDYTEPPAWSQQLFDPEYPGSVAHFFRDMSGGRMDIGGEVLPRVYSSYQPASAYLASAPGQRGQFGRFNLEILEQVDRDEDLGRFDTTGDGYVDMVFVILRTVPANFLLGTATGFASLGFDSDFISQDTAPGGGQVRVRGRFSGIGGTIQRGHTFSIAASTLCHELGHVLGLPDLFDQSFLYANEDFGPEMDSAGIGNWGLMGLGTLGWGVEDGPNAFCAWSLARLGWVDVVDVRRSQRDLVIEDIIQSRRVYRIPLTGDEYLLLENRQASDSHYNRNIPASGLLIWHVDERAENNDEARHKWVDLLCADGQFADRGYPGEQPDPVAGGDNLDFWARDAAYAEAHHGNKGDATDPFDGIRFTRLAHDTNPRLSAYTGYTRRLPPGIAIENIRADGPRMIVDIEMNQPLPGHITADTLWSGVVEVSGDVVVQRGVTLTIAAGTEIRFASFDWHQTGYHPELGELLVFGDLVLQGTAAAPIRFTSSIRRGRWAGIFLLDGQDQELDHVIVENSRHEVVRMRLPPGVTRWSGEHQVPFDLVIPADAELVVEPGTVVRFGEDLGRQGRDPERTELIVEGRLSVEGVDGRPVRFTGDPSVEPGLWYGVRLKPGAVADIRGLQVDRAVLSLSGEVSTEGNLRIADSRFGASAFGGLRLQLHGQAVIERTVFTRNPAQALQVEGRGELVLRQVTVVENGREGIYLGNVGLQAEDLVLERNGLLQGDDPRSGLVAVGGRGQPLRLTRASVAANTLHGLDLDAWKGTVELHDGELRDQGRDGLRVTGAERLVLADMTLEGNRGRGARVTNSPVQITGAVFAANSGGGLLLQGNATGVVEHSAFSGTAALEIDAADSVQVQRNEFSRASPGLRVRDASPHLTGNRFTDNAPALQVLGQRLPERVRYNIFTGNRPAVDNQSELTLEAQDNYWGTVDSTEIAAMMFGPVNWVPFLLDEPDLTTVTDPVPAPVAFALGPGYPNPFNQRVVIPFSLAARAEVRLAVYDALGRVVRRLLNAELDSGLHQAHWDGRDERGTAAASGVYFVRLQAGAQVAVTRVAVLR